jgi:hypothetical protein
MFIYKKQLFSLLSPMLEPGEHFQYSVWIQMGQPGFNPRQGQEIFFQTLHPDQLGHTQPPNQWVLRVISLGRGRKHGWGMMVTTHPHLVLNELRSEIKLNMVATIQFNYLFVYLFTCQLNSPNTNYQVGMRK